MKIKILNAHCNARAAVLSTARRRFQATYGRPHRVLEAVRDLETDRHQRQETFHFGAAVLPRDFRFP